MRRNRKRKSRTLLTLVFTFILLLGLSISSSYIFNIFESKTTTDTTPTATLDVSNVTTTSYNNIDVYGEYINIDFDETITNLILVPTTGADTTTVAITTSVDGGINVGELAVGSYYVQLESEAYLSSNLTADIQFYTITRNGQHNQITITTANNLLMITKSEAVESTKVDILIDPGHGGADSGAVAEDGTTEAELNLNLATIIANKLTALGYNVALTWSDDDLPPTCSESIDAYCTGGRVLQAYDYQANLVISIHHNSGGAEGFEVYSSIFSDHKLATMIRDNLLTVSQASTLLSSYYDDITVTKVSEGLYTKSFIDSDYAATAVDYMYMLREVGGIAMGSSSESNYPNNQSLIGAEAVLIEFGYMDSQTDLAHISDSDVIEAEAEQVVEAIDAYLN